MSFKVKGAGQARGGDFEPRITVVPKAGARKARVSLIVDLGIQKREDFEDETTKETRQQKPCPQVAVFVDLVNDVVDYGGKIGKAQYRLMVNKTFGGEITGINFVTTPPKDAKGNRIDGKPWGFHPRNRLTELCKATGRPEIAIEEGPSGTDIEQLLGLPLIADVEVKETSPEGKKDKDGNQIVYKNVNFKGASKVPMQDSDELDADGNAVEVPAPVADLKIAPRLIGFDTATKEDIQYIRLGLRKMIKLAENYAGSAMQTAIEAYEAENGSAAASDDAGEPESQAEPKSKVTPAKPKATPAPKKPVEKAGFEDMDDDVPF